MDTVNFSPWPEWQLTEKIGSGTYGSVYKCVRAGNDGAACAVKVIRVPPNESEYFELLSEGWSEEEIREHFRELVEKFSKEIDIMFRLQGTAGIVQIYDYKIMEDKTGSTLYIRMELLRSLDKYIPELIAEGKPLTEEQVLTLGVELCEGLAACRKENVIHRDIKPQNIFVTRDGHFKLGDFGIARRFYSMTGTMTGVGTPDFMAPEVWQGTQPGYGHTHYDYRADIYSLGLVLYKCLNNNHLPFVPQRKTLSDTEKSDRESAKSQAGQKRMRGEKLPAPSDASKAAAAAILRACEYWPADRWQSPEEFGSALLEARKALESSGDDRVAVKDHEDEQPPVLPAVNHGENEVSFPPVDPVFPPVIPEDEEEEGRGYVAKVKTGGNPEDEHIKENEESGEDKKLPPVEPSREPVKPGKNVQDETKRKNNTKAWVVAAAAIVLVALGAIAAVTFNKRIDLRSTDITTVVEEKTAIENDPEASVSYEEQTDMTDSDDTQESVKNSETTTRFGAQFTVGDIITFGLYEQDNDTSNGKEDIEWLVLAKDDGKALLISKFALDCQPYNTTDTEVTWATCSLRQWLNGTFIDAAFSADEQKMIKNATVTADANPYHGTSPGNDTLDKVFILSILEAKNYFGSDEERKCVPTAYAIEQGAWTYKKLTLAGDGIEEIEQGLWPNYIKDGNPLTTWWLRTPGLHSNSPAYVSNDGSVNDYGPIVSGVSAAVRPAMWIEI